jgi:1-deoxy-D-xylulose-5-phosphate reductoisomerase
MKSDNIKNIAILGSTGSIGKNSLDVISQHPKIFSPLYLTAHRNFSELISLAKKYKPKGIVITDDQYFTIVKQNLDSNCKVFFGLDGILEILQDPEIDLVLNSLVGSIGVQPTLFAIKNGKDIALANKEALVMAGQLITEAAKKKAVNIFPIDSEHSAIWQCLLGENKERIRRIYLTASGGPFRKLSSNKFKNITVDQALKHPNWKMGKKITIDSATLMNKGLEVIEAFWLYGLNLQQIEIVIHPQSIIHSMVEFVDGSIKAQLGIPDMRIPIQYALTYPDRLPLQTQFLSFPEIQKLTFEKPDFKKFPTLKLAFQALESGGTAAAALNVANEIAVNRFLRKEIGFLDIAKIIKKTLKNHPFSKSYDLQKLIDLEKWAKEYARSC